MSHREVSKHNYKCGFVTAGVFLVGFAGTGSWPSIINGFIEDLGEHKGIVAETCQ